MMISPPQVQETYPEFLEGENPDAGAAAGRPGGFTNRPTSSCSRASNMSRFTQVSSSTRR